jgi:plastocyanin
MKKSVFTLLFFAFALASANATVWNVTAPGLFFSPDSIRITFGDTVDFQISSSHNAQEVSLATWNLNQTTPLTGGFSVPFGGGLLTGLTVGTHYYVCDNHASSGMKGKIVVVPAPPTVVIPNVWINEIHYDNNGTDTLEGYEIAGPAGTNLACYRVIRYTGGGGGIVYRVDTLSGIIPNQACGYGTVWFGYGTNSLQNATDGLVLSYDPQATGCGVNNVDTVIQFLSYEGSFTATNGRAQGLISTNIGVSESATTPVGFSLQLGGVGTTYASLTWQSASAATLNALNNNQFFCGAPQATYSFRPTSKTVNEGDGTVIAGYVRGSNVLISTQTVEVAIKSGSGNAQDINNYTTRTFTFTPGGIDSLPFNLTITDDIIVEGTESIVFALRNPSANGIVGTDSLFTLTIIDNDVTAPVVAFQNTTALVNENVGSFTIEVTIANANNNPTSVGVMLMSGGTATLNTDYSFSPATLTFPANSNTSQFITVNVVDDNFCCSWE